MTKFSMRRAEGREGDFREPISGVVDGRWPGGGIEQLGLFGDFLPQFSLLWRLKYCHVATESRMNFQKFWILLPSAEDR